jgi:hypothetical protein
MRFLGLFLAVVAMAQTANAALLSTWNFDSNANGVVASGVSGSATPFVNVGTAGSNGINGAIASQRWATATNVTNSSATLGSARYNAISFTNNGPSTLLLDSMTLDLGRVGGSGTNVIRAMVTSTVGAGPEAEIFTVTANTSALSSKSDTLGGVTLLAGQTVTYKFYYSRSGTASGAIIDNIQIYGSAVPEPASMAIFGLMGAGVAVRRLRRKA